MGGHPALHRYFKARREEMRKEQEDESRRVRPGIITDVPCKRCGSWLRTYNLHFHRCSKCALMYKIKEVKW